MVERKAIQGVGIQAHAPGARLQVLTSRWPFLKDSLEAVILFAVTAFFLFYGLVPFFGGDGLGLVGADEPRYAQVAREMLARHDYVTPYLWGHPWLEKPALYYWRAMFSFREFGVHDWSARLPSTSFAFILVTLIYLHIRRFRPGGQLDAALITASCAGILSFARGASTDMQLAAPFCIGMLGWYAWYETDRKFWLFDLYFFVGAATLAKGPVAPFLALAIIFSFAALRREWSLLRRTIWIPGVILYFAMVLPWYVAVQRRNPSFFRVFLLEHNLERFATNRYLHAESHWYYIPVTLLGLMPWTIIALRALIEGIQQSVAEWRARRAKVRYLGHVRWGDAFPEFLVLSALFPIVFFSLSRSKLPGYILPAIPPLTILTGDYLNRIRNQGLGSWLLISHALLTGTTVSLVLLLPWHIGHPGAIPGASILVSAALSGAASALLILIVVARFGVARLRLATTVPLVMMLLFVFGVGPFPGLPALSASKKNIRLLDAAYSARPLASIISQIGKPGEQVAVYRVRRDAEYGLSFYRDRRVANYDVDGVPGDEHILVTRENFTSDLPKLLAGRSYEPLFSYPAQSLAVYQVFAKK
ncbi:MAG TPA: glycosyltransferase family 39 protein [Acidobacteriaceae bacterium]|nr:glycosyltransferase family 39 protein [Acidobacteriaceae bacterium]